MERYGERGASRPPREGPRRQVGGQWGSADPAGPRRRCTVGGVSRGRKGPRRRPDPAGAIEPDCRPVAVVSMFSHWMARASNVTFWNTQGPWPKGGAIVITSAFPIATLAGRGRRDRLGGGPQLASIFSRRRRATRTGRSRVGRAGSGPGARELHFGSKSDRAGEPRVLERPWTSGWKAPRFVRGAQRVRKSSLRVEQLPIQLDQLLVSRGCGPAF